MTIKFASEPPFSNLARQFSKLDPLGAAKGYFGFTPGDTWTPNVNLYESDACYMVAVDLAGVEKNQIDVTVHGQRLKLTGKREVPAKEPSEPCSHKLRVHLMEIDHGTFSREVELPADVDHDQIAASFNNGLLWIELPKK